jgi:hypothetical protein
VSGCRRSAAADSWNATRVDLSCFSLVLSVVSFVACVQSMSKAHGERFSPALILQFAVADERNVTEIMDIFSRSFILSTSPSLVNPSGPHFGHRPRTSTCVMLQAFAFSRSTRQPAYRARATPSMTQSNRALQFRRAYNGTSPGVSSVDPHASTMSLSTSKPFLFTFRLDVTHVGRRADGEPPRGRYRSSGDVKCSAKLEHSTTSRSTVLSGCTAVDEGSE